MFDSVQAAELTEEKYVVLIKIMEFMNRIKDVEMKSVYFCGYYDSVDYLKKQKFYNGLTEGKDGVGVKTDAIYLTSELDCFCSSRRI